MESVSVINASAFAKDILLSNLSLPSTLNIIGENAFAACSRLSNLNVPSSVTFVGIDAFASTRWENNNNSAFIILGDGVFYKYKGNVNETMLTFPDGTKRLARNRLVNLQKLSTVIIPESVGYIAKYAFSYVDTSSDSSSAKLREIKIIGAKGSYAEQFADHVYYTFEKFD